MQERLRLEHQKPSHFARAILLSALGGVGLSVACSAGPSQAEAPARPPRVAAWASSSPSLRDAGVERSAEADAAAPDTGTLDAGLDGDATTADAQAVDAAPPAVDLSEEPFMQPLDPRRLLPPTSYARRFANLSPGQCMKELRSAKLPVKHWGGPAKGVANPHKLSGELSGIKFVFPGGKSPFGVLDCRLVLALNEFARVLAAHSVVRVQLDNMYRPQSKLPRHRRGKARNPSQHSYGLAADITRLWLADGSVLSVEDDWHGDLGAPACGPDAVIHEPDAGSVRLRNLVCAVAREGIFNHMLTPGFNAAHRDHFHFDIKRGADYQALR
ncbi:MAG: extensin family protein [Polyangiaceae bacterium]|nr:extensin family protein [Myxococcales bacterium]MCB9590113.1 extensin family protein [Polyangiaceae bacterium]MCB9607992.1 extensin family protein [Polyangiaceae bacterium]